MGTKICKWVGLTIVIVACHPTAEPPVTSSTAPAKPSNCQAAIEDRNIAVQASFDVCSKTGGPANDPTGACKELISAATAAQARSAAVCAGRLGVHADPLR